MTEQPEDFYTVGGTLRASSRSYVRRDADDELFHHVLAGEFCYVLTSRQVGKSSLMVRTARRLKEHDIIPIIIDLTAIGSDSVTVDEWYLGLFSRIQSALRLHINVQHWWDTHQSIGVPQRFTEFIHLALSEVSQSIAIFIDEIDSTLKLKFRDNFFAAIRAMYNDRASDPIYNRVTFVLLGVTTPTDLIQDRERTPFNIGRRITLRDLEYAEARVLKEGLELAHPGQADVILHRIFDWTHGHPYLTQKLCLDATQHPPTRWDNRVVDEVVEASLFSEEARKDTNLTFVEDRLRSTPALERRLLLRLYTDVFQGKVVAANDESAVQKHLELYGLVRAEKQQFRVRNEIYRRVFDQQWINANMPSHRPFVTASVASAVALLLVVIAAYFVQRQAPENTAFAGLQVQNFRESTQPAVRIQALAELFRLGYDQQALQEFYSQPADTQERLFTEGSKNIEADQLIRVVRGIAATLDTNVGNEQDKRLVDTMVESLANLGSLERTGPLISELQAWELGRTNAAGGQNQDAVAAYGTAIAAYGTAMALPTTTPVATPQDGNPWLVYYDRAQAYVAMKQYSDALADFDVVVAVAEQRRKRAAPTLTPSPLPVDAYARYVTALQSHFIEPDRVEQVVQMAIAQNEELRKYFIAHAAKYTRLSKLSPPDNLPIPIIPGG